MNHKREYFNPFPGLRSFEPDEVELFFGRDEQVGELLNRLQRNRFLAVLGTSGSGKSSLVRAGLIPSLHSGFITNAGSAWRVAICKPGNDPIGNLARSLNHPDVLGCCETPEDFGDAQMMLTEATLRGSAKGLVEAVRQSHLGDDENVLVVVDQFEELFRFSQTRQDVNRRGDAVLFSQLLINASQEKSVSLYVILTMRSDFVGDCSEIPNLAETINEGMYLIPRMTRDERREVITGPVAVGGAEISNRLVLELLNNIGDSQDILPVMQHALMRTWDFWEMHHANGEPIDLEHYQAIGGMENALDFHAEEACQELTTPRQREILELMFKRLTHLGKDQRGVRRPTRISEICEIANASLDEVAPIVECFRLSGRSFLMPPPNIELTENTILDISHESLMRVWKRLIQWVHEESESAKIYIELAQTAADYQKGKKGFLKNPELQIFLRWKSRFNPTEEWAVRYDPSFVRADLYLKTSEEQYNREIEIERRRQRRKIVRAYSISAVLVLILVIILILIAKNRSLTEISEAQQRELDKQKNMITAMKDSVKMKAGELEGIQSTIEQSKGQVETYREQMKTYAGLIDSVERQLLQSDSLKKRIEDELAATQLENTAKQVEISLKNDRLKNLAEKEGRLNAKIDSTNRLALAERLAMQAPKMNNPDQQLLFSGQAYFFHQQNGGSDLQPSIYLALKKVLEQNNAGLSPITVHKRDVRAIAFSNSATLATASEDSKIRLWKVIPNSTTLKEILELKHPGGGKFRAIAFGADSVLAAGDQDGLILIWRLNRPKEKPEILASRKSMISALAFDQTGQYLAATTLQGEVNLWQINNAQPEKSKHFQENFAGRIQAMKFLHGQQTVAAGGDQGKLYLWNWPNSRIKVHPLERADKILSLAVNRDGSQIAIGKIDGEIEVHSRENHEPVLIFNGHTAGVTSIDFDPGNRTLVSGSFDKTVRIWDLQHPNQEAIVLNDHDGWIWTVAFTPDAGKIISTSADQTLRLWYPNSGLLAQELSQKIQNNLNRQDWAAFRKQWIHLVGKEILPDTTNMFYPRMVWAKRY